MFTLATLRTLANSTSYQRGQAYYRQKAVGKITQTGRVFAARVAGSYNYRVVLDLSSPPQPAFTCSCPYDFDGICKHAVALGLAVLNECDLSQLPAPPPSLTEAWQQATKQQKEDFLFRLLHRDAAAARSFAEFVVAPTAETGKSGKETKSPKGAKSAKVVAPSKALAAALAALVFDDTLAENANDYDEDEDYYGYHDDADDLIEAAETEIAATILPYAEALATRLRAGEWAATLAEWAATGTALYAVKAPAVDEYDLFDGDYPLHLVNAWQQALTEAGWLALLSVTRLPKPERQAVEAWLTTELGARQARWPDLPATWQPVLLALAGTDEKLAKKLPALLKKAAWLPAAARSAVLLQVARTTHDDNLWATTAESLADTDDAVATQLLHFYRNAGDHDQHQRVATRALAAFPARFSNYVLDHFSGPQAAELRKAALRYRCRLTASLADYDELTTLLTAAELRRFADEIGQERDASDAHAQFVGELLHRQGRPDDLLAYLLRRDWLTLPDAVPALLTHLAPLRPDACVDAVAARIEAAMEPKPTLYRASTQRGAWLYTLITAWLVALHRHADRREQVRTIAEFLLERYPTLHLLKKALREAQLLEDAPAHLPAEVADGAVVRRRPGRQPTGRPPRP